jgi:predicted AAA+ superfamily ATPase
MDYLKRFADHALAERLKSAGAVLIEGAKGCGKSETAKKLGGSLVQMDIDPQVKILMEIDPKLILAGAVPRVFDEWQTYPIIWDVVRHAVDERRQKGQFLLTGSATPDDRARMHSGAGRFSIYKMKTMSLFERGWSSGAVSLNALMQGQAPLTEAVPFDLGELAEKIMLGGWPGLIGSTAQEGLRFAGDYIELIADADIAKVSGKRRDPYKVRRLLQSLARNIATEATVSVLARDVVGGDNKLDDETVRDYMEALVRLMTLEPLPAWNTHIRSADALRNAPKWHFVDPSLAVGALGLSVEKLLADLNYFGLLFESLVIRDMRIYAEANDGTLFHYRDSRNMEVDCIVEYRDGTWGAFEVKMGMGAADEAAKGLLAFAKKVDTDKTKPPACLTVITGNGFAHRRPDGVNVVPLSTLTA